MNKLHAFIHNVLGQETVLGQEFVLDTIFSFSRTWSIYANKRTCRGLDT